MKIRLLFAVLLIVVGAAGIAWYAWPQGVAQLLEDTATVAQNTLGEAGQVLHLDREIITPPPLFGPRTGQLATLSADGVFRFTNEQRLQNGVAVLTRNATLDAAAQNKMKDLFARQYFDHVSPTGEGPADVVDGVHYSYIRVGENLALGNFPSDEALVQAWMDSPGHRANILDTGFQEIGLAVGKGTFEGEETWIGVQTFATPASQCQMPNSSLTNTIEVNKQRLEILEQTLTELKMDVEQKTTGANAKVAEGNHEIEEGNQIYQATGDEDTANPYWKSGEALQAEGQELHAQVKALETKYNQTVEEAKSLVEEAEQLVDMYNEQVRTFNACVESFT